MTTEEKARAYDEALEKAKQVINNNSTELERLCLSSVFPELKESEDERMWGKIIDHFDWHSKGPYLTHQECDECKTFLERQKEQKSINNSTREKIISRATSEKQVVLVSESDGNAEIGWDTRTLEDAKNLLEYSLAFINKQLDIKPAEWSEEDEEMLNKIITDVECQEIRETITPSASKERISWLKSLRSQSHWKPSEEQMEALNDAVGDYNAEETASCEKTADILTSLYNDLQKLL